MFEISFLIYQGLTKAPVCEQLSALRSFLKFLYKEKKAKDKLVLAVPSSGSRKTSVVPTITKDEENRLLQSIDRSTCIGKCNYAMVLLVMHTGLRSIDITNLYYPALIGGIRQSP